MEYLRYKQGNVERLVSLENIMEVKCVQSSPIGGPPYRNSGEISYNNGCVLNVPFECAEAVIDAFKGKTVPSKKKEPHQ